jgi:diguanylate cyclase (GGDEF)-like protein/PAS domain S-box-containing protein
MITSQPQPPVNRLKGAEPAACLSAAAEIAAERTRLLYQGSQVPTLFILLSGLVCAYLLWSPENSQRLTGWLVWLVLLAVLRLIQVRAFNRAPPSQQAHPHWRRMFLLGAGLSGLTLAFIEIALVVPASLLHQALLYGLICSAILSAGVVYAASWSAFLTFTVPSVLPFLAVMLLSNDPNKISAGVLALILSVSLLVVTGQVNRLIRRSQRQRANNHTLISNLGHAKAQADGLNLQLAREVEQRRRAERDLRGMHDELEMRVIQRNVELDETTHALSKSEARLALALEASELGLWDWNLTSDELHHSQLFELFGLQPEAVTAMLRDLTPRVHIDDLPLLRAVLVEHLKGHTDGYAVEYRVQHVDGRWVWIEDRGRAVARDANGRVLRMLGTRRDITLRKSHDEEQRLAAMVFEAASQGIVILDPANQVIAVNQAFTSVTGYGRDELLGQSVARLIRGSDARRQYSLISQELERDGHWQGELLETRKNGELYPQWLQLSVVRDAHGRISHTVGFFVDLTARRDAEERLRYLSNYDELTGLANRTLFKERLHEAGQRSRQSGQSLALLHIDLDRFKLLNDSLGHELADQLLRQMSKRINQCVPEAHTLARLSGDEFAVLFDSVGSLSSLARMASRLLAKLRQPITVGGQELVVSASIGISLLPDNAREISTLLSQANMAMQHAKHLGGNTFQFFTDNLQACTLERLQLETQLRKAIVDGQLEVYYQPKLSLANDCLSSAEALVRWRHPTLGLVPPGDFIGLAEETGLIGAIGEFVLREACRQARAWQLAGLAEIRVAVNISAQQLRQGNLTSLVRQILEQTALPPHLLELELTESLLLDNVESVIATCQQLRSLGIKLSIDDFGTGYSSLSYLKRFPVHYVKVDQSFIRDLGRNPEDAAITCAIIAMAHGLGLKVVAEGVETQVQLDFLKEHHCDEIQGYLVSPALPASAFAQLLHEQLSSD